MTKTKEQILEECYPDFDIPSGWMFDGPVSEVFKAMDEYYNQAIDDAIERIKIHDDYVSIGFMDDLIKHLEQLKKPLQ